MNLKIKIKNREYKVGLQEVANKTIVNIDGNEYVFDSKGTVAQLDRSVSTGPVQSHATSKEHSKQIKTPLAGTISEILVQVGAEIKVGQKLLILSAMKMENEILAETQGKIKEILVNKDQPVKAGALLIILE